MRRDGGRRDPTPGSEAATTASPAPAADPPADPLPDPPAAGRPPSPGRRRLVRAALAGAGLTALGGGALGVAAPPRPAAAQDLRFFRIGTGTTGGTYFPIGGIIAGAISGPPGAPPCEIGGSCGVPGLIAVAQVSSGSVENVEMIQAGAIEAGLSQADIAFWAHTGTGLYRDDGPLDDLRAIARLYAELVHIVVRADAEVETVADLAGRRVALGDRGSGTLIGARLILEAYGLEEETDYTPVFAGPEAAADLMLEDGLDAFFIIGGAPLLAVEDLARRLPIRLLPLADPTARGLLADLPFFTTGRLPTGAYPGVDGVNTLAVGAILVVSAAVEDDLVFAITKSLWHPTTQQVLAEGHPRGREIRLDNALRGLAIPLHDGAAAYYREVGMLRQLGGGGDGAVRRSVDPAEASAPRPLAD
jgi:hypothetical protein